MISYRLEIRVLSKMHVDSCTMRTRAHTHVGAGEEELTMMRKHSGMH